MSALSVLNGYVDVAACCVMKLDVFAATLQAWRNDQ